LNEDATLANIRAGLAWLALETNQDDTAIIFFSGHGARVPTNSEIQSSLLPVDADPTNPTVSTLMEGELSRYLASIKSSRLLVFLDACHSGGSVTLKTPLNQPILPLGFEEKSLSQLTKGKGKVAILSSRSSEVSLIMTGSRNSIFTEQLLRVLRGEAEADDSGVVRVLSIFRHLSSAVPAVSGDRQHPIMKATDLENDFPVALRLGGAKSVSPSALEKNSPWEALEAVLVGLYPLGPLDQDVWMRAGGDVSRLRLDGSGRTRWFAAMRLLRQGGGGASISPKCLIEAASQDFPNRSDLKALDLMIFEGIF